MVLHGKNLYSIFAVSNHISMATAIKAIPTLRGKKSIKINNDYRRAL
jgi:hypothetical protein